METCALLDCTLVTSGECNQITFCADVVCFVLATHTHIVVMFYDLQFIVCTSKYNLAYLYDTTRLRVSRTHPIYAHIQN